MTLSLASGKSVAIDLKSLRLLPFNEGAMSPGVAIETPDSVGGDGFFGTAQVRFHSASEASRSWSCGGC